MFVSRGILTFDELLRKSVDNLAKRTERSTNVIMYSCLSAFIYLYSPIRKWWNSLLFFHPSHFSHCSKYLTLFLIDLCM